MNFEEFEEFSFSRSISEYLLIKKEEKELSGSYQIKKKKLLKYFNWKISKYSSPTLKIKSPARSGHKLICKICLTEFESSFLIKHSNACKIRAELKNESQKIDSLKMNIKMYCKSLKNISNQKKLLN